MAGGKGKGVKKGTELIIQGFYDQFVAMQRRQSQWEKLNKLDDFDKRIKLLEKNIEERVAAVEKVLKQEGGV
jgi:hypothetical protein